MDKKEDDIEVYVFAKPYIEDYTRPMYTRKIIELMMNKNEMKIHCPDSVYGRLKGVVDDLIQFKMIYLVKQSCKVKTVNQKDGTPIEVNEFHIRRASGIQIPK